MTRCHVRPPQLELFSRDCQLPHLYDAVTGEYLETWDAVADSPETGVIGGLVLSLGKVQIIDSHGFPQGRLDRWYGSSVEPIEVILRRTATRPASGSRSAE